MQQHEFEKLIPCPFCQCNMKVIKDVTGSYKPFGLHEDECMLEGIELKYSDAKQLAQSWNSRVPAQQKTTELLDTQRIHKQLLILPPWADTLYSRERISTLVQLINDKGWPEELQLAVTKNDNNQYTVHSSYI